MRRSLRLRLALAAALSVAIAVALTGAVLVRLAEEDQVALLDDELDARVRLFAAINVPPVMAAADSGVLIDRTMAGAETTVRVVDDGDVVLVAGNEAASRLEPPAGPGTRTVDAGGDRWRTLTVDAASVVPNLARDGDLRVEVGLSLDPIDESVAALRRRALLLGAVAVPLAAVIGFLVAEIGLRPLRRLRRTAEAVAATGDLERAHAPEGGPEEVAAVARSLNRMLERLEQATAAQRAADDAARGFTAGVAHELRTPLTSLRTNLALIDREPPLPDADRAEVLAAMRDDVGRVVALFDALEALARGELATGRLEDALDLGEVLDAAIDQLRRRHPGVTVSLDAPDGPVPCRGWAEGLRVLVDNLLTNAATHGAQSDGAPGRVAVELRDEGDQVRLTVDDDGPGIPPDARERVVQAFVRGPDSRRSGLGLGLALVAQQVRLHGGHLDVGESPLGGARLVVRLPRREPDVS